MEEVFEFVVKMEEISSSVEMQGWLQKWTNYLKGYQKRWFILSNGMLCYYRNQAANTCRGSISLDGALIYTEDTCNIIISTGGNQTFHLRAPSEKEKQMWVTSLEFAKAKAINAMESEEEEMKEVSNPPDDKEMENIFLMLIAKLEDVQTCGDLVNKHGDALEKVLAELESSESYVDILSKFKHTKERATLFRIASATMINATREFLKVAQHHGDHGKKWQKAFQYQSERRQKLEKVVEELAKQNTKYEEATNQRLFSDDEDDIIYYDAETGDPTTDFMVDVPMAAHHRPSRGVSTYSVKSECSDDGDSSSGNDEDSDQQGTNQEMRCVRTKTAEDIGSQDPVVHLNPNESSQSVPKRIRRKRVPDKPNYALNLWSIMKNCIGRELIKIPMPVNFSEPLSMLQRLTEDFEYSEILDIAARCIDSCEQLSYIAAFTVSSYATTSVRTGKPFNPLLGETYECDRMEDLGWRCLNEQVSHHPPMAAQYCEGRGWKCWQEFSMSSKFRGKYLQIIPMGISHLVFDISGNHYTWRKVTTTVRNIIVGKLWVDQHGEMDIVNHLTGDKCHLKYIPYSYFSRDAQRKVTGCVMSSQGKVRWVLNGTWDTKMEACKVLNQKTIDKNGKPVLELGPSKLLWIRKIPPTESEKYYNFTELACQLNEPEEGIAPTDSRLRPDQRLMEEGKWDEANSEKIRLEEKQRAARRLRENDTEIAAENGHPIPPYDPEWFNKERDKKTGHIIHVYRGDYWTCKEKGDWSRCRNIF